MSILKMLTGNYYKKHNESDIIAENLDCKLQKICRNKAHYELVKEYSYKYPLEYLIELLLIGFDFYDDTHLLLIGKSVANRKSK